MIELKFELDQNLSFTKLLNNTNGSPNSFYLRKSLLNLTELGQMNGSAGGAPGGEDEELPAPHELGEELKFTGRYGRGLDSPVLCDWVQFYPNRVLC